MRINFLNAVKEYFFFRIDWLTVTWTMLNIVLFALIIFLIYHFYKKKHK